MKILILFLFTMLSPFYVIAQDDFEPDPSAFVESSRPSSALDQDPYLSEDATEEDSFVVSEEGFGLDQEELAELQAQEDALADEKLLQKFDNLEAINTFGYEEFNDEECEDFLVECESRINSLEDAYDEARSALVAGQIQDLLAEVQIECEEEIVRFCSSN